MPEGSLHPPPDSRPQGTAGSGRALPSKHAAGAGAAAVLGGPRVLSAPRQRVPHQACVLYSASGNWFVPCLVRAIWHAHML